MTPIRTPLTPINPNQKAGSRLNPILRAKIVAKFECGASHSELSEEFLVPKSTIRDTIRKALLRNNYASLPSSGQPVEYIDYNERAVLRIV